MSVSISLKLGKRIGEPMKQEELDVIIKEHKKWLEKNGEGKRADLREANLEGPDGEHKGSAVSLRDESLFYNVGEIVKIPENKFDGSLWHEGAGIYFFLTRGEAERFEYKKNDEGKNKDGE